MFPISTAKSLGPVFHGAPVLTPYSDHHQAPLTICLSRAACTSYHHDVTFSSPLLSPRATLFLLFSSSLSLLFLYFKFILFSALEFNRIICQYFPLSILLSFSIKCISYSANKTFGPVLWNQYSTPPVLKTRFLQGFFILSIPNYGTWKLQYFSFSSLLSVISLIYFQSFKTLEKVVWPPCLTYIMTVCINNILSESDIFQLAIY